MSGDEPSGCGLRNLALVAQNASPSLAACKGQSRSYCRLGLAKGECLGVASKQLKRKSGWPGLQLPDNSGRWQIPPAGIAGSDSFRLGRCFHGKSAHLSTKWTGWNPAGQSDTYLAMLPLRPNSLVHCSAPLTHQSDQIHAFHDRKLLTRELIAGTVAPARCC